MMTDANTVLYTFVPKGSMCMACAHGNRDCSALDFASMQPMIRHGRVTIVKCTGFKAFETNAHDLKKQAQH